MENKNLALMGLCLLGLLNGACASNGASATGASGATGTTAAAANEVTTTSSTTGHPSISAFYPPTGSVTALPTSVQVQFNQSAMDPNTAGNRYDWPYVCAGQTFYPTSVSLSGGVATLSLPTVSGLPTGDSCVISASSSIVNTSGAAITGTLSASYMLGTSISTSSSTEPTITAFSPPGGSYTAMSSTINVTFSDYTMTANTVTNIYNWVIVCGSTVYYPTNVYLSLNVATVALPTTVSSLTSGTCTLTASASIANGPGYTLSGATSVSYVLPTSSTSYYNPANNPYTVLTAEGGGGGNPFSEIAPSGYALSGFETFSGTYTNALTPIWGSNYVSTSTYSTSMGTSNGSASGSQTTITCPGDASSRAVGIYGRSGSYVDQIGLICEEQDSPTPTYTYSATVGGSGDGAYEVLCPTGTYVVAIMGRAGSYIDQIQLGCQ